VLLYAFAAPWFFLTDEIRKTIWMLRLLCRLRTDLEAWAWNLVGQVPSDLIEPTRNSSLSIRPVTAPSVRWLLPFSPPHSPTGHESIDYMSSLPSVLSSCNRTSAQCRSPERQISMELVRPSSLHTIPPFHILRPINDSWFWQLKKEFLVLSIDVWGSLTTRDSISKGIDLSLSPYVGVCKGN